MGALKTFVGIAIAAGVGGYVGDKLYAVVEPKLPATLGPSVRTGAKLGFQAGSAVLCYAVISSML